MIIVVDTNIVFSIILKTKGEVARAFFKVPSFASYYAPDFLITELQQHKNKLQKISGLSDTDYEVSKTSVFSHINFIDVSAIPTECNSEAAQLTKEIDFKDIQFVALTLFMDGVLWTGDRQLYNGLRRRKFQQVISTQQIKLTFGT